MSSAIDDDDEPMSLGDEAPDTGNGGDDDDSYDGDGDPTDAAVARGGGVTQVPNPAARHTREPSQKAREALAAAIAKQKAKGGDPDDDENETLYPADDAGSNASPAALSQGGDPSQKQNAQPPLAAQPPAPSLDPEVTKLREQLTARGTELDTREQQLAERERSSDIGKLKESYWERGGAAVLDLVKKWTGITDETELRTEVADLVSDLSEFCGLPVPAEHKERIASRRVVRTAKLMRQSDAEREAERTRQREREQEQVTNQHVAAAIHQEVMKPEHVQQYPWLGAEPNAGQIVLDVALAQAKQDGTKLSWQEAAKRANAYLQSQASAFFDKRKHLLTQASANAGQGKQQQARQGDPQVRRSQAPNAAPKPDASPQPVPLVNGKWSAEAHREAIKRKHRQAFKDAAASED